MRKSISFQSDIDNVVLAENFIDSICTENQISEEIYGNVLVATIEAVANAIKHGNRQDLTKYVFIDAVLNDGRLEISIKDEGMGFDPASLPDPTLPENILKFSGRGIYLIKSLSDEVEFQEGGTLLKMTFKL